VRARGARDLGKMTLEDFSNMLRQEVDSKV